jgi:hypothetical protein
MSIDPMRIYVLWAPSLDDANDPGLRLADALHLQLDALGMIRDGVGFRIPVRKRDRSWGSTGSPRPIDWTAARSNVVIIVVDDVMRDRSGEWGDYLAGIATHIERSAGTYLLLPVVTSSGDPLRAFEGRSNLQAIHALTPERADGDWDQWLRRVTMYVMGVVWAHQRTNRGRGEPEARAAAEARRKITVFLSHAKMDGEGAARLVDRFRRLAPKAETNINSVELFFDAYDTVAGASYSDQFEEAIRSGALLSIVTDAYHGRPWCMWELLKAKEHGSPIVVWDLSHRGTMRSFPYLGNVPTVRTSNAKYKKEEGSSEKLDLESISEADIERVLLSLLSEAMRMEVWTGHAQEFVRSQATHDAVAVCARPPELADVVHQAAKGAKTIIYPDPPICLHEQKLLNDAFPQLTMLSLGELVI